MSTLVFGTAGHVDHGKTTLVRALTGVDTDRLAQEKARGISIELGFAELVLGATSVSLIDVPGHERFVRHMVAGAGGIDGYLLCVAADDGVMPQTLEHLAVLDLLGVNDGVVAITKCDLADPARAMDEIRPLVGADVELVPVVSTGPAGIDRLEAALSALAQRVGRRRAEGPARLFVDRAFTVPGAGTVVTGTLWGAPLHVGDRVRAHPSGEQSRVRVVQVHDRQVDHADGGRVALNLAGIHRDHVPRGSVVVSMNDMWESSPYLDVAVQWLASESRPLATRRRLQLFHGTCEVGATCVVLQKSDLIPGARGYVQLRLDAPVLARPGDRIVLRSAARRTVGGGMVIDSAPSRHGRSRIVVDRLRAMELGEVAPHDEPTPPPSPPPPVTVAPAPAPLDDLARGVQRVLDAAGTSPPREDALMDALDCTNGALGTALRALAAAGTVTRAGELWFATTALDRATAMAVDALVGGPLGIGELRDLWGVGRRHALAIAAHMDRCAITRRIGDRRALRRSARAVSSPAP